MATTPIVPAPLVVKNAELTLSLNGTDVYDYQAAVATAKFTPSAQTSIFTGIGGQKLVQLAAVDWTLELAFPQDWQTANSLSAFLLANAGATATAALTPSAGGDAYTATVLLVPGGIGGTYGQQADETVSLPCTTAPAAA
jgi:hypothetical protein